MNTESRLVKAALASVLSGRPESVRFESCEAARLAELDLMELFLDGRSLFSGPVRLHSQWSFPSDEALLTLRGIAIGTDIVLWTVLVRYDEETETANL